MKALFITLAAILGFSAAESDSLSETDLMFARDAADCSIMEIKLGQLAQTNASSPSVKKLGQHMISDYTKINADLHSFAEQKQVILPSALGTEQQEKYDKLARLKGAEFDKAYTKCMVKAHKRAISMYKKEIKKGDDLGLKAFADRHSALLDHHLKLSKETADIVRNDK